jgi:autotransporter-associated beta strand protein
MHRWKSSVLLGLLLVVAAVVGGSSRTAHAATTRVWIGAASNPYWSSPTNWSPTGAPVDGDSVVFSAATTDSNQRNDLGYFNIVTNRFEPLRIASLTLNKGVLLVGNGLAISSTLSVGGSSIQPALDLPIELAGNVQVSVASGSTLFMSTGGYAQGTVAIDMAGHTLTKTGLGGFEVNENLIGSGSFTINGGATKFHYGYPVTFGGTIAMGPGTSLTFAPGPLSTPAGPGPCGAPNAAVVLSSANMSAKCPASVGSVAGTGTIDVAGEVPRLTIAVTGETFEGVISGNAGATFTCCGEGVQTLRGASTFTGNVLVKTGSLLLAGATFPAASLFTVQGKGDFPAGLGGYGTFGTSVLTTALLDLASVNGKFGLARFPQLLLAPDVEVDYEIKGATPGTGFTQVVTTDKVDIDSARLSLDFGSYVPAAGQSFTLIKGFTTGTFRNYADDKPLAEGAVFTASGMQFKITYNGAADDVVITRQGGAATPTPSPSPTSTPSPQMKYRDFIPMVARES